MKIYSRDSKYHANSVMETLTIFALCCGKVFVHMSRWMVGRDSVKLYYQKKRNFTAT